MNRDLKKSNKDKLKGTWKWINVKDIAEEQKDIELDQMLLEQENAELQGDFEYMEKLYRCVLGTCRDLGKNSIDVFELLCHINENQWMLDEKNKNEFMCEDDITPWLESVVP